MVVFFSSHGAYRNCSYTACDIERPGNYLPTYNALAFFSSFEISGADLFWHNWPLALLTTMVPPTVQSGTHSVHAVGRKCTNKWLLHMILKSKADFVGYRYRHVFNQKGWQCVDQSKEHFLQTNNHSEQDSSLCLWIIDYALITFCFNRKGTWSELALWHET